MEKTRIQQRREALGWSKQKLADLVGCSRVAISQYESRKRRPTGEMLVRIAAALGVSSAWLMEQTDDPEPKENLLPEWKQVVDYAIQQGLTPQDVHLAIQMFLLATGRLSVDKGQPTGSAGDDGADSGPVQTLIQAPNRPHGDEARLPHQGSRTR